MRNIRLIIQYDGSRYAAFQKLGPNTKGVLVEDKIIDVLEKMTNEKITLVSAAKLEAGVHALQQVANFTTNTEMKEYEIKHYLNQYLPRDIAVVHVDDVPERFHSQLNAKSYKYEYRISMGEVANVFERKYSYYSFKRLDVKSMRKVADTMLGKQDFRAFCNNKKMKKTTIREIFDIEIIQDIDSVKIKIHGNDFWPYMVRKMVGAICEAGLGNLKANDVREILESKDPSEADFLAEPQGLFLTEVLYI
ncbi:MAG: tRNA pseudouridine(38-40) synthase TruA [bacterium]|nr:tRNA pseudouridine(38-40) synthase TruA [bacterium]